MGLPPRFIMKTFLIKLFNKEYWNSHIINFPVYLYIATLIIRSRELFFFTAANPSIETGGLIGESKIKIQDRIADKWKPKDFFVQQEMTLDHILEQLDLIGILFPIIGKPNRGERGLLVSKLDTQSDLELYLSKANYDFIIQEYIDFKEELSILYYYHPDGRNGKITSVTLKEFLHVKGDGISTIEELIHQQPRAILQLKKLKRTHGDQFKFILKKGEILELEPIGNHSRGTKFINGAHLIDAQLTKVFDEITRSLEGVYFARYDLRCSSIEALKRGEDIRIVELNGVGADPAHIYDPNYPIWKVWRDFIRHWYIIYTLSMENKQLGIKPMSWKEMKVYWKEMNEYYSRVRG